MRPTKIHAIRTRALRGMGSMSGGTALLAGLFLIAGVRSDVGAETINIHLDAASDTYALGDAVDVEVRATTSSVLVAYGFDLRAGEELSYDGFDTGPGFVGVAATPDGDGIAGLSFTGGVDGVNVLLGTAHYEAVSAGDVLIRLSMTARDLTEGFARSGQGFFQVSVSPLELTVIEPPDELPPVIFGGGGGGGTPNVPEPATVTLLTAGLFSLLRRRR